MWDHIIIHHSADRDDPWVDASDYRHWHQQRGWRDIGYHYVCELVGDRFEFLAMRPLWMGGSHMPRHNTTAIGVCLAGNFSEHPPPAEQLRLAASQVAGLCLVIGVDETAVHQHSEFKSTECPGVMFPWQRFLGLVRYYIAKNEIDFRPEPPITA